MNTRKITAIATAVLIVFTSGSIPVYANEFYDIHNVVPTSENYDEYQIENLSIEVSDIRISANKYDPYIVIMNGSYQLVKNVDYTVAVENNESVGVGIAIITGIGEYHGTVTKTFNVLPNDITSCEIEVSDAEYTGNPIIPNISVTDDTIPLIENVHYKVDVTNNVNIGTATVMITGIGEYEGTIVRTFNIAGANIKDAVISLPKSSYIYTGNSICPDITVTYQNNVLVRGRDYSIEYQNNCDKGTAKVTVVGKGGYIGTLTKTFMITAKSVSECQCALSATKYTYNGKANTPSVTVKDGNKVLKPDKDYVVSYSNNIEAGKATVNITGKGNYSGTVKKSFVINKLKLSDAVISVGAAEYTGKALSPKITVKSGSDKLTVNTDYTVSYKNNTKIGKGTVTITGKGSCIGSITKKFKIVPKKVSIKSSYSCTANSIKIGWNKVKGAAGYRIYRWDGKSWAKIKDVKSSTLTYNDTKRSAGSVYKYKIKAYAKVGKSTYWGAASSVKSVVTAPKKPNLSVSNINETEMTLQWNKIKCSGYKIYQYKSGDWKKIKTITDPSTVSYRLTGLSPNTNYKFKIRAYKTDANKTEMCGSYSSEISAKTKFVWSVLDEAYYQTLRGTSTKAQRQLIVEDAAEYVYKTWNGKQTVNAYDSLTGLSKSVTFSAPLNIVLDKSYDIRNANVNVGVDFTGYLCCGENSKADTWQFLPKSDSGKIKAVNEFKQLVKESAAWGLCTYYEKYGEDAYTGEFPMTIYYTFNDNGDTPIKIYDDIYAYHLYICIH